MTPVRRFLTTARRVWWLFVLCAVVGLALSAGLSVLKSKSYSASTQVLITAGDGGILSANSSSDPALNVADAQLIAQSAAFYQKAAVQLPIGYEDLEGDVTVTNPTSTDALDFSVSASSPAKAIEYANVLVRGESRVPAPRPSRSSGRLHCGESDKGREFVVQGSDRGNRCRSDRRSSRGRTHRVT
jgi:capsular polysaccharide biosynthesis protein